MYKKCMFVPDLNETTMKTNTVFYRVDDYNKNGHGSFVGFFTTLREAKSRTLHSNWSEKCPAENIEFSQITAFNSGGDTKNLMGAWESGEIIENFYYI